MPILRWFSNNTINWWTSPIFNSFLTVDVDDHHGRRVTPLSLPGNKILWRWHSALLLLLARYIPIRIPRYTWKTSHTTTLVRRKLSYYQVYHFASRSLWPTIYVRKQQCSYQQRIMLTFRYISCAPSENRGDEKSILFFICFEIIFYLFWNNIEITTILLGASLCVYYYHCSSSTSYTNKRYSLFFFIVLPRHFLQSSI